MLIEVRQCARCGRDHAVTFYPFTERPYDATHWGMCPTRQEPILMLVREANAPAIGPYTPIPGHQFAYAIHLGLSLHSATKDGDAAGIRLYGEKLLSLAIRWTAVPDGMGDYRLVNLPKDLPDIKTPL